MTKSFFSILLLFLCVCADAAGEKRALGVGIDFGRTHVRATLADQESAVPIVLIEDDFGSTRMPSAAAFPPSQPRLVGRDAMRAALKAPQSTVLEPLRVLHAQLDSSNTVAYQNLYPAAKVSARLC